MHSLELNDDKFLLDKKTGEILGISDCKNKSLDPRVYFSPNNFPFIDRRHTNIGSCFADIEALTGSWNVNISDGVASIDLIPKNTPLDEYRLTLKNHIRKNIQDIYNKHSEVNLFFSGGIDSLVCLAVIVSLGYAEKTRLHIILDYSQPHPDTLSNNQLHRLTIKNLLDSLGKIWLGIEYHKIDQTQYSHIFNESDYDGMRCHSTWSIIKKYYRQAWINGGHGNRTLLHHRDLADEILIRNSTQLIKYQELKSQKFYTQHLTTSGVDNPLTAIQYRGLSVKPWHRLSGFQENSIYTPLANNAMFDCVRSLDFSRIDLSVIAHATLGRELVDEFSKGKWNQYIVGETVEDGDNIPPNINIKVESIDPKLLRLDHSVSHATKGLDYLEYCIKKSHGTGLIDLNVLCCIKLLDRIEELVNT